MDMASYRRDRAEEDIKRELTAIIPRLKDPRISGMLSVVRLELAPDMSRAKVYVSAMEGLAVAKTAARGLQAAGGFIQREIASKLRLRTIPFFEFIADNSIEYSAEISKKIESVLKKDGKTDATEDE